MADSPPALLATAQTGAIPTVLSGRNQAFRALQHRNFRLFVFGQIVSLVGTWMQSLAQSWLVYRITHSELLLGTAWFCAQIPVFALAAVGGLISDRFSRHRIVIVTQTLSMLQALALAALALTGRVQVWHVLTLAVVLGTINAFDIPARQALIVQLSSKEDLLSAISLNSAIFNAARVIGPALAGMLVAALGEGVCFLINGLSFLAVIGALLAMRVERPQGEGPASSLSQLVEGFRYAWNSTLVRNVLIMMAAGTIASSPAIVLMPFFADAIFHRGADGLGYLMGAMGIGAVIGTLVLARKSGSTGLARVIAWSSVGMGVAFLLFAASPWFFLSVAIMPFIGFSVMRQMAAANTLIQTTIPDQYRGRIMAMYAMTVVGLVPFGSLGAGAMAHAFGARATLAAGGILALCAAFVFQTHASGLHE